MKQVPLLFRWPNLLISALIAIVFLYLFATYRLEPPGFNKTLFFFFCPQLVFSGPIISISPHHIPRLIVYVFAFVAAFVPSLVYGRLIIGVFNVILGQVKSGVGEVV